MTIIHLTGDDSIPDSLWTDLNVTQLILGKMGLTSLDERIGGMTSLTRLQLPRNALSSLPESLANLSNLDTLGFAFNNFTEIPSVLFQMNIKTLCIESNPLEFNLSSMSIPTSIDILLASEGTQPPGNYQGIFGTLGLVQ